jgi:hypothetical protein
MGRFKHWRQVALLIPNAGRTFGDYRRVGIVHSSILEGELSITPQKAKRLKMLFLFFAKP